MALTEALNSAKKKLFEKLGNSSIKYCQLMKSWFTLKISKEEFDMEARKTMNLEQVRLHNEFLLCLFNKCNFLTNDNNRARIKKNKLAKQKRSGDKGAFQPVDPVNYLPQQTGAPPQHLHQEAQRYCANEILLPDDALIMGRLMLGAWELGMDGAEDSAAEVLVVAVQVFLKNILTAIFSQRSGYKLRGKRIMHGFGDPVPNPWIRNTLDEDGEAQDVNDDTQRWPLSETEYEQKKTFEIACAETYLEPPAKLPVSLYDVIQALAVHKSVMPSHSFYALTMEKVICTLNHPGWDELEAARLFKT